MKHTFSARPLLSCVGKERFRSYGMARAMLARMLARGAGGYPERLCVYRCRYCLSYHVGALFLPRHSIKE